MHPNPKRKHSIKGVVAMLFICCVAFSSGQNPQKTPEPSIPTRSDLIKEAEKHLGKKYKSKVQGQMMDCSGYTRLIMSLHGVKITRSSVTQINDGVRVKELKEAKPGDILVFKGRNPKNNLPGHVGIAHHWSNDTLFFIHSSVQKGITIDHMFDPYYKKRFMQVRDVIGQKLN
jgi:cell wall-associated NlpC family hydrolase